MTNVELAVTESGTGPPVVLLHAFPLSSDMWREQRVDLAESARVITPDLRGFGRSELGQDEPSLDHVADDVAALLDRLGLDQVVLGGLSMGGYAAMAFLRRHPDRLLGLILADTKATADPPPAREKRERIAARLDAEASTAALVDEVVPSLLGGTSMRERPAVVARVAALVAGASPAAAAWAQRAMAARPDSLATLTGVAVPALVVVGDEDELSTVADAEAMVEALPDARLAVLAGAGHLSSVEVPRAFSAEVRDLVAALS